jgi:hypothetical protein
MSTGLFQNRAASVRILPSSLFWERYSPGASTAGYYVRLPAAGSPSLLASSSLPVLREAFRKVPAGK